MNFFIKNNKAKKEALEIIEQLQSIKDLKAFDESLEDLRNLVSEHRQALGELSDKSLLLDEKTTDIDYTFTEKLEEIEKIKNHILSLTPEKGDRGEKGEQGKRGLKGERGLRGLKGKDGKDGKDGRDGLRGKDGSEIKPKEIVDKLESLKGDKRLDAKAIKNLPKSVVYHGGGGSGGGGGTSIHNDLQGLQGGQSGQYYHMTSGEHGTFIRDDGEDHQNWQVAVYAGLTGRFIRNSNVFIYEDGSIEQNGAILRSSVLSLEDDAFVDLGVIGVAGYGFLQIGNNQEWVQFYWDESANITLVMNSENVINTDTDGNLCIFPSGGDVRVRNRLGSTLLLNYRLQY